jgi:NADH-quinone oxidoreductase subunit A
MPFDYIPILIQVLVAVMVAGGVILIATFLGTKRPSQAKLAPYESGMTPVGQAWRRFPIKFFVTAMLFVLFDVEVIFFYPWAVLLRHLKGGGEQLTWFIVGEMFVFIAFLVLGYVYILKRKGLQWE